MPGNTVKINELESMEWYVGDSMMDSLIVWLDENGVKVKPSKPDPPFYKMKMLDEWINELVFPSDPKNFIKETKGYGNENEVMREFVFYTNDYQYTFYAVERKKDDGYLGCGASTRKYRAGENWLRGNDLPDGPFTRETWDRIISRIVAYELVKLSDYASPSQISNNDPQVGD